MDNKEEVKKYNTIYRDECINLEKNQITDISGVYLGQGDYRTYYKCKVNNFTKDNLPPNYAPNQWLCPFDCQLFQPSPEQEKPEVLSDEDRFVIKCMQAGISSWNNGAVGKRIKELSNEVSTRIAQVDSKWRTKLAAAGIPIMDTGDIPEHLYTQKELVEAKSKEECESCANAFISTHEEATNKVRELGRAEGAKEERERISKDLDALSAKHKIDDEFLLAVGKYLKALRGEVSPYTRGERDNQNMRLMPD